MSAPLIAVKLHPVGRAQSYPLGDLPVKPRKGDRVVVQTDNGPAVGTVVRSIRQLEERRRPPAESPQRVVRLATRDDVLTLMRYAAENRLPVVPRGAGTSVGGEANRSSSALRWT